jgi:hypothetical protein
MTVVILSRKTRVAIIHPVPDLNGITSKAKEIVDNARRMARPCPEVEKDRADMRESYTRRSIGQLQFTYHHHQPRKAPRSTPGRHPANEKKFREVHSESKPTKLGKRSTNDGKKTFRLEYPAAEVAT